MASMMKHNVPLLLIVLSCVLLIVSGSKPPAYPSHQGRAIDNNSTSPTHFNASANAIAQAQSTVAEAIAQQSKYNAHRVANPRRNTYRSRHSRTAKSTTNQAQSTSEPVAPTLDSGLRAAAALLAEQHAAKQLANGTLHKTYSQFAKLRKQGGKGKRDSSNYWASQVDHGQPPMGWNPSYLVYRDVTDPMFGAKGDGVTDDTDAINAAIAYGGNCGEGCLSSSTIGTFIYFPPGIYLISSPINAYYYSQLVGDPDNLPIIRTSPSFVGLGAIQSDVYIPNDNGDEWYVEQSNFYRQVRNFIIDITDTETAYAAGLHWQVAQATSLNNVLIVASTEPGTTQMGIFTENGSGGFMSDCEISGGQYGIYGGNQQYTVRSFQMSSQTNASICLIWDWGWTWSDLLLSNAPVGISLINPQDPTGQQAGSTYIMDSQFDGITTAIQAHFGQSSILDTSIITLDNVGAAGVNTMVAFTDGSTLDIPAANVNFVVIGNIEVQDSSSFGSYSVAVQDPPASLLDQSTGGVRYRANYFSKSRPQYESLTLDNIVNVKDHGAVGDGVTDDTSAIVSALALATIDNLIYFPPGSYIVTSTIVIPSHARVTGQVWSQVVASGSYFKEIAQPKAMIQVGNAGDVGTVEISDMLFTSIGELPGLILMEWNVQAGAQGSVGIWDSHFRVGGAYGSKLQVAECPNTEPIQNACVAATMMLRLTPGSNGYFENMWLWVADHDIDDAQNSQITVGVARGLLIESTSGPTWLYGTASEHSMLYQYNFANATNMFAGMIQTESPYFQATEATESPGPFNSSVGLFTNDPVFPDSTCTGTDDLCNFSWAVIMQDNTNLTIAGAGLYSWYDNYIETCVDTQNCQQRLVLDAGGNSGLYLWNLITIGAVEMISSMDDEQVVLAKNNTQAIAHPFWSALASYLDDYEQIILSCDDDSTDPACQVDWKCDLSQGYPTVDSLDEAASKFPNQCMNYYALGTLYSVFNTSMANYTTVDDGYDGTFGYYVDYVKDMVPAALQGFMAGSSASQPEGGPGNKYFDCTCEGYGETSTQQCPFTYFQLLGATSYTMTYTLRDEDGFYNDLQANYSISRDWVEFGDTGGITHQGGRCLADACVRISGYLYKNIPTAVSKDKIDVANPKDVVTNALPKIGDLRNNLLARQMDVNLGSWNGSLDDLLQTFSTPIFMIQDAVNSMAEAKQIGETERKEEKLKLILEILGAVFAFIPFLDDLTPELEALDGVLQTISLTGSTGLDISSIISDPASAPMILLDMIAGGELKSADDFQKAAAARRAVTEADMAKIGKSFEENEAKFQEKIKPSCRT